MLSSDRELLMPTDLKLCHNVLRDGGNYFKKGLIVFTKTLAHICRHSQFGGVGKHYITFRFFWLDALIKKLSLIEIVYLYYT